MAARDRSKPLSLKQQFFVTEYLKCGDAQASAIKAGYAEKSAAKSGYELLHNCEAVKQAVAKGRASLEKRGIYGLEKAMKEAESAIDFAKETKNANAYVKAVELRSKLNGLLIEKHEVKQVGFQININRRKPRDVSPPEEKPAEQLPPPILPIGVVK